MNKPFVTVLIPAAGKGTRMGSGENKNPKNDPQKNKVLREIQGEPLLAHTLAAFQNHPGVNEIRLIARKTEFNELSSLFAGQKNWNKIGPLVEGGAERQDSVRLGLKTLAGNPPDLVLVHDGARPFVTKQLIDRILKALEGSEAVAPVLPLYDTIRLVTEGNSEVLDRTQLFRTQTPQGFFFPTILAAHEEAEKNGFSGTDDVQLVENAGKKIHWVPGEEHNRKITTPDDMEWASTFIKQKDF